ncbi:PEP-CTERM sorting domain-containing protein [Trichormus sp. NMC-1]|uniref:PEP-CTERM sorting domain-containing protein n=1 Tax=Trichormus sp. NMC-1 TaxID=1853259 RepID=UPI0008DC05F3|nr:PEP-CTERM sorting domain-containing protein [Trichormus sp. NMC-1]
MNSKFISTLAAATTLAGIVATAGTANAASLTYTTSSGGFEYTDIKKTLSIQKFDSALGILKSVQLNFTGDISGNAGFENRSSNASTVTVNLGALINLTKEGLNLNPPLPITPSSTYSYNVATYDGTTDFTGESGRKIDNLTATEFISKMFTDNSSLDIFTGVGNLDFLFSAIAKSTVTGSGNISSYVETLAKANLSVTYNYDTPNSTKVPEPSTLLGFGLVAGFGLLSQRKKSLFQISK